MYLKYSFLMLNTFCCPGGGRRSLSGLVLVVDDDPVAALVLSRVVERQGYSARLAANVPEARAALCAADFVLALIDVTLPGGSGVTLADEMLQLHPETCALMVSGSRDESTVAAAIKAGVHGYLAKPFRADDLRIAITNALRCRGLQNESRVYRTKLDAATVELAQAHEENRHAVEESLDLIAATIKLRDVETSQHLVRMGRYSALLARAAGFDTQRCELISVASTLHDVGKVGVPDHILRKPSRLSNAEFAVIRQHAELGYAMLSKSDRPLFATAAVIARTHHERWDGNGYPWRLAGADIPIEGRIGAIADVFDALSSRRVYKPRYESSRVLDIMREGRATHFDPELLELFLGSMNEVQAIATNFEGEQVSGSALLGTHPLIELAYAGAR
jgi:putative two-component system response regulator